MISAFPPPLNYSESPEGFFGNGVTAGKENAHIDGTHLGPQNIMVFTDYDKALAYAKEVNKPLFVDFTGHNCVNCRKMEQSVWGEKGVIEVLRNEVVIVSLHVDERLPLPKKDQVVVELTKGKKKLLQTTGDKWMFKQISEYKVTAQPYYVMQRPDGTDLPNGSADYQHHSDPATFSKWLNDGMKAFKK
jgi:thiol:disulfide interchange protein DsbD